MSIQNVSNFPKYFIYCKLFPMQFGAVKDLWRFLIHGTKISWIIAYKSIIIYIVPFYSTIFSAVILVPFYSTIFSAII